jgi:Flp pilus assembly protein TadG
VSALRQWGRDDGAAAVEFALLFPLFIMLAIGMISSGFAFERWINVTQASREASRYAATLSINAGGGTTLAWLTAVSERALLAADLKTDATHAVPGTRVCVAITSPGSAPTVAANHQTLTTNASGLISRVEAAGLCPGVAMTTGDYVQVRISRPSDFNYVVASPTIQVGSESISQFEAKATP